MAEIQNQGIKNFYQYIQKANWQDFCVDIETNQETKVQQSIQVNFEPQESIQMDSQTKKKLKKKQYKKRKRQKQKMSQKEQAKIQLATIIQEMYCQSTTFQQKQDRIEICLSYLDRGDKFHNFLTQVIRIHVNSVQRQIWQHTQQLLRLYPVQKNDSTIFYYKFAHCILLGYQHIRKATSEIKKIIRFYMILTENRDYLGPKHRNYRHLEGDTFAFMIQSDLSLKSLIRICQSKLMSKQPLPQNHQKQIQKMIKICYELDVDLGNQSQRQQQQAQGQYQQSTATSFDQDQNYSFINSSQTQDFHQNLNNFNSPNKNSTSNKNKRKIKKKKIKQTDLHPELDDILTRLQRLQINLEERDECCVQQQWIQKIQSQLIKYQYRKKSFKKEDKQDEKDNNKENDVPTYLNIPVLINTPKKKREQIKKQ